MAFGHILVPGSVPGTELASRMCQRNRNGLYPVGDKVMRSWERRPLPRSGHGDRIKWAKGTASV